MCTSLSPTQVIDNRFTNQVDRAQWGAQNGTMSQNRADHIEARDSRIMARANLDESQNGGQLTPGEDARLTARLNNVGGRISQFNQGQFPSSQLLPT